jgi:hypothetical protein
VSGIYRSARSALWQGQIDMTAMPVAMALVGPGYVFDDTDTTMGDVTDIITTAGVTVTGVVNGEVLCNPVTFTAVADGTTIAGLVTFIDSGDQALVGFADRRADSVPLNPLPGTGGDVTFTFVDYLLKI